LARNNKQAAVIGNICSATTTVD